MRCATQSLVVDDYDDASAYSDDLVYRWWWERRWADGPGLCWVGLNPSTGDTTGRPRPTLRKVVALAKAHDLGAVTVVNLFSWRRPSLPTCGAGGQPRHRRRSHRRRHRGGQRPIACHAGRMGIARIASRSRHRSGPAAESSPVPRRDGHRTTSTPPVCSGRNGTPPLRAVRIDHIRIARTHPAVIGVSATAGSSQRICSSASVDRRPERTSACRATCVLLLQTESSRQCDGRLRPSKQALTTCPAYVAVSRPSGVERSCTDGYRRRARPDRHQSLRVAASGSGSSAVSCTVEVL